MTSLASRLTAAPSTAEPCSAWPRAPRQCLALLCDPIHGFPHAMQGRVGQGNAKRANAKRGGAEPGVARRGDAAPGEA